MQAASPFDISIYFPSKYIKKVIVKPLMQISSLRIVAIPNDFPCSFIYNGFLLDESKTFEYYKIKDNDVIVISPCEAFNTKWMKITEFHDNLKNVINLMSNKKLMNEVYRLKDLRYNKIEMNPSRYSKIGMKCRLNSYTNECFSNCNLDSVSNSSNHSLYNPIEKNFPTVIPETMAEKPFDEALTFIWNE